MKPSNSSLGLIAGLLAAALSATPSPADFRSPSEDALLGAYVVCNLKNSRRIASQEGDPMSLAMAARGMCQSEELNLERDLVRSSGSMRGMKILDRFRKKALVQMGVIMRSVVDAVFIIWRLSAKCLRCQLLAVLL